MEGRYIPLDLVLREKWVLNPRSVDITPANTLQSDPARRFCCKRTMVWITHKTTINSH
jgi:DNA-directed RNA polymerase subunit N (RpoN/RPB10)